MNSYIDHPDERYDINNGILICKEHHEMYHNIYGKGSNTKKQFEEFVLIIRIIEQIVELKKDLTDTAQSIIITERKTGTECTEITSQNITLLLHQN